MCDCWPHAQRKPVWWELLLGSERCTVQSGDREPAGGAGWWLLRDACARSTGSNLWCLTSELHNQAYCKCQSLQWSQGDTRLRHKIPCLPLWSGAALGYTVHTDLWVWRQTDREGGRPQLEASYLRANNESVCYKCPELSVSGSALFICTDETVRLSSARSQHADNKAKNVRPCRRSEAEALSGRNTALWEFRERKDGGRSSCSFFKISHLHSECFCFFLPLCCK